jgi:hypothetical protein
MAVGLRLLALQASLVPGCHFLSEAMPNQEEITKNLQQHFLSQVNTACAH